MNQPLITKYRPSDWDEVIGHEDVINSLRRVIKSESQPHAYLFTGAGGTGKTTLARIVAKELGCEVIELDAASNSGIDNIRELIEVGNHRSLSGSGSRLFLLDEVHRLSKPAFDVLLKTLEEPPEHLYFALCTTELNKVPDTIVQRCFHCALRSVKPNEMESLLTVVADLEGWEVSNDVMQAVIQHATGQPRKGLKALQAVHDAKDRNEVRRIISLIDAGEPLIALVQYLLKGNTSWTQAQNLLSRIEDDDFAEAAIVAGRYMAGALVRAEDDKKARHVWQLMNALTFPTETYDKKVAFITAVGRMIWGE